MANEHGGARKGAGRPKGSTQNLDFKKLLQEHGLEIIQIIIDKALSGDDKSLKLCFERLIPIPKYVEISGSSEVDMTPLVIQTH